MFSIFKKGDALQEKQVAATTCLSFCFSIMQKKNSKI